MKNEYTGKKFSILADSISTFKGCNPEGYNVFYDGEKIAETGVATAEDTWWSKVISYFGGTLLVNNSWSGSRVTRLPDSDTHCSRRVAATKERAGFPLSETRRK